MTTKRSQSPAPAEAGSAPVMSPAELLHLATAHGQVLERLAVQQRLSPEELLAGRALLTFVNRELRRRTLTPRVTPRQALEEAQQLWDPLRVEVPRSHRAGIGQMVTEAKRAAVKGLKGPHAELVKGQRAFNQQVLDMLVHVVDGHFPSGEGLMGLAKAALEGLDADERRALRPAARALASVVEPVVVRQRAWNRQAVRLLMDLPLEEQRAPTPQVHEAMGGLKRLGHLPVPADVDGATRVAAPLWAELFRRQARFNEAVTNTLMALFGLPCRADDGRGGYPESMLAHEAQRSASVAHELAQLPPSGLPLISVVTPTWRADRKTLTECVESVLAQSYPSWELCLVDDGSPDAATRELVQSFAARDPRIRVKLSPRNGGIALATNEAIGLARGEFVAFLDHDDTLAPHALGEVALYLARRPDTDLLYTDEDRLDSADRRRMPFFKPDWSPDLLRSCNYMCHFLVARRSVVEEVGRLREGFDGAQDYDLVLRLSERARHVGHVAEVLYHWRAVGDSTAQSVENKPKAATAGIKALSEHLTRCGQRGVVKSPIPTHYRVEYEVPGQERVALVVAGSPDLGDLASALRETTWQPWELCTVGAEPSAGARHVPWTGPFDLGAMYERAREQVKAGVYVFLHEDVAPVDDEWLTELVGHALRPEIGVVAPRLVNADETIQDTGWVLTDDGRPLKPFENMVDAPEWTSMGVAIWIRNCLAVSPACFAVRAQVLEQLGGFTKGLDGAGAVLDLCLRANDAGLRVICTPHARLVHHATRPEPTASLPVNGSTPRRDPYFNPHLSPAHTNGALRYTP